MQLNHLNPAVRDVDRARRSYERYFGFSDGDPIWHGDVLFLRNAADFDLALAPTAEPTPSGSFHFGFRLAAPDAVRALRGPLLGDGTPIGESWDEPHYVGFKCADPDGYAIEVYWE
jgi:catechol 2,3-dioxygenase-like lactoylglutathione lyase family enzyme